MKKARGMVLSVMILFSIFGVVGCGDTAEGGETLGYEQITAEEAKEIMDSERDYVILDVRTVEEFSEGHIEGAVLLDYEDVGAKAHVVLPDKDRLILVYCRSGRRSKIAAEELVGLGYTNIKEFGGILDWPYGTVK